MASTKKEFLTREQLITKIAEFRAALDSLVSKFNEAEAAAELQKIEDEIKEIALEIIRNNADERVMIGLDYFDASINRVLAWVTGAQNMQKALLIAALTPSDEMRKLQDSGNFGGVMAYREAVKELPFGEVYAEYCRRQGVLTGLAMYEEICAYEKKILPERA